MKAPLGSVLMVGVVGPAGAVNGEVIEAGIGGVSAEVAGLLEGNVTEHAGGNLETTGTGTFKGNSEHELPGACTDTVVDFQGAFWTLL